MKFLFEPIMMAVLILRPKGFCCLYSVTVRRKLRNEEIKNGREERVNSIPDIIFHSERKLTGLSPFSKSQFNGRAPTLQRPRNISKTQKRV